MDTANCTLRCRLRFELLEDRRLLSITVDTLVDEFNGVGIGAGTSLREAIVASPSGDAINISVTGAIELSALGELTVNKSLVINGPGADLLTIRAYDPTPALKNGDGSRVFNIDDGNDSIPNLAAITGVALTGGDVNSSGGAIYARESLTLANCTVTGNATGYSGGAVAQWSSSHLAIVGSTISGNTSSGHGGGISKVGPGNLTIANSTISGNSANTGTGGGVYAGSFTYSAAVFGSTITGNSASSAGGIFADPLVALTLENSIVAGNSASQAGPDVRRDSGAISIHYTLVGDNSGTSLSPAPVGSPDANGNLIGTAASPIDPMLGALADNGGPTQTHALLQGSPAQNAGDPSALTGVGDVPQFDQRGAPFTRVAGGRIDMGAVESQIVVNTLGDENDGPGVGNGTSLREALALANVNPGLDAITFDPALFAAGPGTILLTMGELQITTSLSIDGPGDDTLTIDASGNDPTPTIKNGDGSRIFEVSNEISIGGMTLTGGDAAGGGGALRNAGELSLFDCIITRNGADGGGGIENRNGGTLTVADSTFSENFSSANGGGISSSGTLSVLRCTVSRNTALTGAGVHIAGGSSTVSGSTLSNNTAFLYGGGVRTEQGAMVITNTTISGNSALNDRAGGIYGSGNLTVNNSTITGNTAANRAAGIYFILRDSLTLRNSVLAENTSTNSPDLFVYSDGGTLLLDHSLLGNNSGSGLSPAPVGSPDANGNLIGTAANPIDPLLGPLADNGGATMTHALIPGSPALDAGDPAAVAGVGDVPLYDQRGTPVARVVDGNGDAAARIDMGAFETQAVLPVLAGDYNLDRSVDAADYVVWRKTLGGSAPPYSGADGSGDGTINQGDRAVWMAQFGDSLSPPASARPADELDSPVVVAKFVRIPTNHPTSRDISYGIEITSNKAPARTPRASTQPNERSFLAERHDRAILAWLSATVLTSRRTGNDAGAVPQADDSQFDAPPAGDTASLDVALAILEF